MTVGFNNLQKCQFPFKKTSAFVNTYFWSVFMNIMLNEIMCVNEVNMLRNTYF